jgi:hypothetical protein
VQMIARRDRLRCWHVGALAPSRMEKQWFGLAAATDTTNPTDCLRLNAGYTTLIARNERAPDGHHNELPRREERNGLAHKKLTR